MEVKDLTKEEQLFFHERYMVYMKDEYEEDFKGNQDSRTWKVWAYDKAFDDALCMDAVREALKENE